MAEINIQEVVSALVPALRGGELTLVGESFNKALLNSDGDNSFNGRGIRICYGQSEGLFCLQRAYQKLTETISPEDFAQRVAHALQAFAGQFPDFGRNLTYAHFLLHGIEQPTVEGVIAKIIDNSRIIHESDAICDKLLEHFGRARLILEGRYRIELAQGDTDDFHGLSLRLVDVNGPMFECMAKTGALIDTTNKTAVIINVQGRKPGRYSDQKDKKKDAERGREFGRLRAQLEMDPRTFIITQALKIYSEWGIQTVKAITPQYHVMNIAGHPKFSSNYDSMLEAAGLTEHEGVYRKAVIPLAK